PPPGSVRPPALARGGVSARRSPPGVMRAAVRQSEQQPTGVTVLYFHPWEFDPDQPTLPLGRAARFRTYVGISRTRSRLRRMLARYGSRTMIDAVAELEAQPPLPTFRLAAA